MSEKKNEDLIKNQTKEINSGVNNGIDSIVSIMAEAFKNQGVNFDSVKAEVLELRKDSVKYGPVASGVSDLRKELRMDKRLSVTPSEFNVVAKSSTQIAIVVTNNLPYPVFMVVLSFDRIKGEVNFGNDFMFSNLGATYIGVDHLTYQIPQINSGSAVTIILQVKGDQYTTHSKVKLFIYGYHNSPISNFTMDNVKELPKTIQLPEGFFPPMQKPDTLH